MKMMEINTHHAAITLLLTKTASLMVLANF